MPEKTELVLTIGADGVVRIKTRGLKGQECLVETKGLEDALGKVKNREKTGEFYETREKTRTTVKNR